MKESTKNSAIVVTVAALAGGGGLAVSENRDLERRCDGLAAVIALDNEPVRQLYEDAGQVLSLGLLKLDQHRKLEAALARAEAATAAAKVPEAG